MSIVNGDNFDNVIKTSAEADEVYGLDGSDLLDGGAGDDLISGGAGNDTMYGGAGNDTMLGGLGNDQVYGGEGNDVLNGGAGNDVLIGGEGEDTYQLNVNEGADNIKGYEMGIDQIVIDGISDVQQLDFDPTTGVLSYGQSDFARVVADGGNTANPLDNLTVSINGNDYQFDGDDFQLI